MSLGFLINFNKKTKSMSEKEYC